MPTAAALPVTPDDLAELRRWARSAQLPAVLVRRARILLVAADGAANTEIAQRAGVSRPPVTCQARISASQARTVRARRDSSGTSRASAQR
jgi:hypothetical protein